jgi:hypothetical protein
VVLLLVMGSELVVLLVIVPGLVLFVVILPLVGCRVLVHWYH